MSVTPPSDAVPGAARLSLQAIGCTFDGMQAVADLSLDIAPGEIVCLLGPSGCGKTTTLRIAAGVERQQTGRVVIEGRTVSEAGPGAGVHMPPEARRIGLMFQDFALFPHLTVAGNIAFGLRGSDAAERRRIVADYLERVGLAGFEAKYPHQLSGGEQQRVALARALAPRPRIILMDEPFSGLDHRLRDAVRDQALALLKEEGTAVLLVTHEPGEAMRMGDRIALMRAGRIVQTGAPHDVYNHPVDREAAAFFSDLNVVHGTVRARRTDTQFGPFPTPGLVDDADVEIIVRPQHLTVVPDTGSPPAGDPEHGVPARGRVVRARFIGTESLIEVRMDHDDALLRATVPHAFLPEPGTPIWLCLRRDRCFVFPCCQQRRVASPFAAE